MVTCSATADQHAQLSAPSERRAKAFATGKSRKHGTVEIIPTTKRALDPKIAFNLAKKKTWKIPIEIVSIDRKIVTGKVRPLSIPKNDKITPI
jgi:hypothetical protein